MVRLDSFFCDFENRNCKYESAYSTLRRNFELCSAQGPQCGYFNNFKKYYFMNAKHYILRKHWLILLIGCMALAAGVFPLQGQESYISNRMVNLSRIEGEKEQESVTIDRQIEGNTIHLLWVEYEYNKPGKLYYRRSADLGETWDNPILIMTQSDSGELTGSEYRKSMAVSGNTVHIAVTDYNYADNGTGRLYYFRSDDNGVAFSEGTGH